MVRLRRYLTITLFFRGRWAVSICLLVSRAKTVGKVLKRACLLGAGEWFLLILVSFIFGPQVWFQSIVMGGDGDKPMIIGPGIMALVCLAVFALTRFRFRETAPAPVMSSA